MKSKHVLLLSIVLFSLGCKRDDLIPGNVSQLVFECPDGTSESFFEGYLNEEEFCYYDGKDKYHLNISLTSAFVTNQPSTSTEVNPDSVSNFRVWGNMGFRPEALPSNTNVSHLPHLKHYVRIETPSNSAQVSMSKIIKDNIVATGDLPMTSDGIDHFEGFNVVFTYSDLDTGLQRIFETFGGSQEDSYLRITELEIDNSQFGVTTYSITFEFSCNLYYNGNPKRFYARIENAVMHLRFSV